MKIRVDVDATPQELRRFFGLPDLEPIQEEILQQVREQMRAGAEGYDPLTLMKPFMTQGSQGFEALQKMFWDAFRKGGDASGGESGS